MAVSYTKSTGTTWENGPEIVLTGGTVGAIQKDITTMPAADIIVMPVSDMDALDKAGGILPGSKTRLGRIDFGVDVKAGAPHPDISSREKFIAVMKNANAIAFNDPATQSLGGIMIAAFLARPEYAGVKPLPGGGARDVAAGKADIGIQTMSELLPAPGVEFAGLVPAYLNAHIELSVAVLAHAASPKEAAAFIKYITRPKAAAVWKPNGVER